MDRAVRKEEARDFAIRSSMLFVETSALTSENVNQCFHELVSSVSGFVDITLTGHMSNVQIDIKPELALAGNV